MDDEVKRMTEADNLEGGEKEPLPGEPPQVDVDDNEKEFSKLPPEVREIVRKVLGATPGAHVHVIGRVSPVEHGSARMTNNAVNILYAVSLIDVQKTEWAMTLYIKFMMAFIREMAEGPAHTIARMKEIVDVEAKTDAERVIAGMLLGVVITSVLEAVHEL